MCRFVQEPISGWKLMMSRVKAETIRDCYDERREMSFDHNTRTWGVFGWQVAGIE